MSLPDRRYYTQAHSQFRDALARFVREEIMPEVEAWEEAGEFPRELYRKAAAVGLLGIGFPKEYGGIPADVFSPERISAHAALEAHRCRNAGYPGRRCHATAGSRS